MGVTATHLLSAKSTEKVDRNVFWGKVGVAAVLIAVLYAGVFADMVADWWTEPNLSQGFLIPPLAAYVAWICRRDTLARAVSPDNHGTILVGCACVMLLLGKLGAELFLQRISFIILLTGLIWTFWGLARLRSLAFPLVLLSTMVPLPVLIYNAASVPLRLFASDVASELARLLGVTIYRDGNIITLANTSLGVEEACSGLNSLSAMMVAALLLGYLFCRGISARVILFALSIPLSIAVNILRITGTAVIADYNIQNALGFYHSFSGWLVFVLGFGLLFLLAKSVHALVD
jgi:exosortase